MFLELPSRIPWTWTIVFNVLLCTLLLLNGSTPELVGYLAIYVVLAAMAFNLAGGMRYGSGAYVMFNALLVVLVGCVTKALTWEPLQNNLKAPVRTFQAEMLAMLAMCAACWFTSRFRRKRAYLQNLIKPNMASRVVAGCCAAGFLIELTAFYFGNAPGSIGAILFQINVFLPLTLLLGAYYKARQSGGRSATTWIIVVLYVYLSARGLSTFSKESIFMPTAAWMIGALAGGYYIPKLRLASMGLLAAILIPALSAYSQYGRSHRDLYTTPVDTMIYVLTHRDDLSKQSNAEVTSEDIGEGWHLYDQPRGLLDRLNMIAPDDSLINMTDQSHQHGMGIMWAYLYNILPHFLAPDKPFLNTGNTYAHEIGILAPGDITTGISFSPAGEAYHLVGFTGLLLVMPIEFSIFFLIVDSVVGSLDYAPWALLYILRFVHVAPEGGIGGPIYESTVGVVRTVLAVLVAAWLAPALGTLLLGPERVVPFGTPESLGRKAEF